MCRHLHILPRNPFQITETLEFHHLTTHSFVNRSAMDISWRNVDMSRQAFLTCAKCRTAVQTRRSNTSCHQALFQRQIIQLPIVPSSWQLYKCLRTTTPCKKVLGTNEDAIAATEFQREGRVCNNRETAI